MLILTLITRSVHWKPSSFYIGKLWVLSLLYDKDPIKAACIVFMGVLSYEWWQNRWLLIWVYRLVHDLDGEMLQVLILYFRGTDDYSKVDASIHKKSSWLQTRFRCIRVDQLRSDVCIWSMYAWRTDMPWTGWRPCFRPQLTDAAIGAWKFT